MDTAAKRYSAISPLMPWRAPPLPDSTIDQGDRQHVAYLYSGILAGQTEGGLLWRRRREAVK